MRVYPRSRYVAGAMKVECPRCGFDFLTTEMMYEERTGKMVCTKCYDPIHPQDLPKVKGSQNRGTDRAATEGIYGDEN